MDKMEKKLQVLLILWLSLGLLAVDVNSTSEDQEASLEPNQPPIQMTHEENTSFDGHTSKNPDDSFTEQIDQKERVFDGILKSSFEKPKNETARNPAFKFDSSFRYFDGSLDFTNESDDNPTLIDYLQQGIHLHPHSVSTTPVPLNTSQFPNVLMHNLSNRDNKVTITVNETANNSAYMPENFDYIFKYINKSLDFFNETKENQSTLTDYQQQDVDFLPSSGAPSSVSLNNSSEFHDVSMQNISNHNNTVVYKTSRNPVHTRKSESITGTTPITLVNQQSINQNLSEPAESDVVIENNTDIIKNDEEYTVVVPRICSKNSTITRLLHLINVSLNKKNPANYTCKNMKDMNIVIKSQQLFDEVNEFLKAEAKTDHMVFIKVIPNATLSFEVLPHSTFHGVFIPMFAIIIVANLLLWLTVIILCICLYKKCCQRRSTSLDLYRMPHLNLKTDYNLTPIPRPSISFPDSSRDFLHAHAQDNSNRPRQVNTLKSNNSSTVPKTYDEVDKETGSKKELSTFTMSSDRNIECKPSTSQDYESSYSWNSLREMNYAKKSGIENAAYKKW